MKHEDFQELLVLKHYGELTPEAAAELEDHLAGCASCREVEQEIEQTARMLSSSMPEAGTELVNAARTRVLTSLEPREAGTRTRMTRRLTEWLDGLATPFRVLAWSGGALSMAAVGFVAGYLVFGMATPTGQDPLELFRNPEVRVTGVSFEQIDPKSNQVALSFDASRKVHLEGSLDDARIQRILAHALIAEENPGVRLRAVSALQQQAPADQETSTALIGALRTDPNPAVRQKAVETLRSYPSTPEIRAALVDALENDRNARIRIEAIDGLSAAADSGFRLDNAVLEQLGEQLSRDENSYVRHKGIKFLEQAGYRLN